MMQVAEQLGQLLSNIVGANKIRATFQADRLINRLAFAGLIMQAIIVEIQQLIMPNILACQPEEPQGQQWTDSKSMFVESFCLNDRVDYFNIPAAQHNNTELYFAAQINEFYLTYVFIGEAVLIYLPHFIWNKFYGDEIRDHIVFVVDYAKKQLEEQDNKSNIKARAEGDFTKRFRNLTDIVMTTNKLAATLVEKKKHKEQKKELKKWADIVPLTSKNSGNEGNTSEAAQSDHVVDISERVEESDDEIDYGDQTDERVVLITKEECLTKDEMRARLSRWYCKPKHILTYIYKHLGTQFVIACVIVFINMFPGFRWPDIKLNFRCRDSNYVYYLCSIENGVIFRASWVSNMGILSMCFFLSVNQLYNNTLFKMTCRCQKCKTKQCLHKCKKTCRSHFFQRILHMTVKPKREVGVCECIYSSCSGCRKRNGRAVGPGGVLTDYYSPRLVDRYFFSHLLYENSHLMKDLLPDFAIANKPDEAPLPQLPKPKLAKPLPI